MSDKPQKIAKLLRSKAQDFLAAPEDTRLLMDIVRHFESGTDLSSCLLAIELVFSTLLKDRTMYIEVVPLKPVHSTADYEYRDWLKNTYERCFNNVLETLENESSKIQVQGLATAMALIANEGRFPLENKGNLESYVPLSKLKMVLMKLLSNKQNHTHVVNKYTEYLTHDDILFFTWKLLPSLTAKSNPNETYIINYLHLLEKLQIKANAESSMLCGEGQFLTFDEAQTSRALNKVWHCVMLWEHSQQTHKKLLIVLLEKALPHLEKPLLLTDFLMDSLDIGGPISLLALQGIFTLIQSHNLNYPNIFTKLYSMFEPEIFHTKYKARLFYLSDLFLSSTHLPENLVAAFAKRLARLALIAPSEDVIVICMFIGNLILRHPGLKSLLNHPTRETASTDPYIMEERDPVKSNAIHSSLWEIQSLQQHVIPNVATAARFINSPLPTVEWDLSKVLNDSGDDIFDKELKKHSKLIALTFDKPTSGFLTKNDKILQYWHL